MTIRGHDVLVSLLAKTLFNESLVGKMNSLRSDRKGSCASNDRAYSAELAFAGNVAVPLDWTAFRSALKSILAGSPTLEVQLLRKGGLLTPPS